MRHPAVLALALSLCSGVCCPKAVAADTPPFETSYAPLVRQLRPGVVNIRSDLVADGARNGQLLRFFGLPGGSVHRRALGSGFIITPDGYVVTNNHVIDDASTVHIKLADGREFVARVVGADPKTDLALLKVDGVRDLPTERLGHSAGLEVGDRVLAIGNPFGLGNTVTAGIVSAKERYIAAGPYDDFLQTDASINPGNSGGPLFDLAGTVVGINTAIVAGGQGIGFAIPIDVARDILEQLRTKGFVTRGMIGVGIQEVTPALARAFELARPEGALISSVDPGGPADKAGLRVGDVISTYAGQAIGDANRLPLLVAGSRPGSRVHVQVVEHGVLREADVLVGELHDQQPRRRPTAPPHPPADRVGVTAVNMDASAASQFGLPNIPGVLVTGIDPSGPASGELHTGDVIIEAGGSPTRSVSSLRRAISSVPKGGVLLLRVRRGDTTVFVAIELA